ncbi:COG4223 family protein [Niveispirillum sp. KHB5.9]|uniref:COG4223 family protein n=1 Tax=Niveispirillum sp. KHB5.9 TaxID=3400269 RepID=UPI003A844D0F
MSDTEKTGKGMSLEELERDIASQKPAPEARPATKPVPPAPAPVVVKRGGGLLGGTALLVALGAAGLSGYGFWLDRNAPPAAVTDLSPLATRVIAVEARQQELQAALDSLSRRQDALEARLSGDTNVVAREPVPNTDSAPQGVVDISVTEALADRIAALEDRKPESVDLGPLSHRVQTLEEVSAEVIPRLTMLETRRQMGAVGEALIIAVGQLQAALTAGRPYGRELRAAQALAANDTALLDLLAPLSATAETGLAGDIELREKFRLLAPAVLRADRDREGAHWTDRVLGRVASVITLRRASGEVAGDDADAVLARAEAALLANDLPRAVEEMEKLPAHAAAPAAEWLKLAEARMAAEAAAATLADLSLARMAGTAKDGAKDGEAR